MPCLTDIVDDLKQQVRCLSNGDSKFVTSTPSRSSRCSSFSRPSSPDVELEMVSSSQFKNIFILDILLVDKKILNLCVDLVFGSKCVQFCEICLLQCSTIINTFWADHHSELLKKVPVKPKN